MTEEFYYIHFVISAYFYFLFIFVSYRILNSSENFDSQDVMNWIVIFEIGDLKVKVLISATFEFFNWQLSLNALSEGEIKSWLNIELEKISKKLQTKIDRGENLEKIYRVNFRS